VGRARIDDSIFVRLARWDFERRDEIPADVAVSLDHLREAARLADHQFVGKQHCERLVADDVARAPHRMPKPKRLLLANADDLAEAGVRGFEHVEALALATHRCLELEGMV